MIAQLFPRTDESPFLHPKEIAERVSANFPEATVDWDRANAKLQDELKNLEETGTPEPVLNGHKNLFGNTVFIEIYIDSARNQGISFSAYPDSPIELSKFLTGSKANQDEINDLVERLGGLLDYDVEFAV